jgi:hypothetical protein
MVTFRRPFSKIDSVNITSFTLRSAPFWTLRVLCLLEMWIAADYPYPFLTVPSDQPINQLRSLHLFFSLAMCDRLSQPHPEAHGGKYHLFSTSLSCKP